MSESNKVTTMLLRRGLWIVVVAIACVACVSYHTSKVVDTPPHAWWQPIGMDYPNADTLEARTISLLMLYSVGAPDNARIVVQTISPDGYKAVDTVVCNLPRGKHSRNYFENVTPFCSGAVLRCNGNYKVTFTPTDTLRGVWAVGLNTTYDNGKR